MHCIGCGCENPEGTKFCGACGRSLTHRCPDCGVENPPQFKFCGECGAALRAEEQSTPAKRRKRQATPGAKQAVRPAASPTVAKSRPATPEAERRQLTVMFCDLVGSTALSEQLDPEELREIVHAYQQTSAEVIERYEGYIAQYLGDGLLVYFGYPVAHEDDAQRAARAGLGIVAALHDLNTRRQHPLQVRLGIHTGLVVVGATGEGDTREPLALGDTPNIAARLQSLAEPGTVVISAATCRLLAGMLDCQALGLQVLKGVSTPIQVYRVMGESGRRSRLDIAATTGLTPLVGREKEVALLGRRWEQAREGAGQVVLLSGEPGIGKSRLVHVLKEHIAGEAHGRIEWYSSPYYQNSAFYPVIEHLQRLLQFRGEDTPQAKLAKLEERLAQDGLPLSAVVPLFAPLLSLPLPERYPPLALSPQRQKQKTLDAFVTWVLSETERQPVVLIMEDLQWVDPSTLELLGLLLAQAPTIRLLLVLTCRPEFTPPWGTRSHMSHLTLSRLGRTQAEGMVEQVTAGKALPAEVVQQIVAKTDGVPLFVEELTKTVIESGLLTAVDDHYELRGPLPPLAIPSTLHASLLARLDRLSTVREIAQLGATIGREFSYELLAAVSPLDEATLQQGLRQLVAAELVYQRGLVPQAHYLFKHALIQDTAYQSLLKSTRQQYHQQIAQVLAARFPETAETHPELLARHYTEAGLGAQAIPYWQQAGVRATERSAHREAIAHLSKGLEVVQTLPDTPERPQLELLLQIALGLPLQATKGMGALEVKTTYARALELCRQIGETPLFFSVMVGLAMVHLNRAEFHEARTLAEQLLQRAQEVNVPFFLVGAHGLLGIALYFLGELVPARAHLEWGVALYDPQWFRFQTALMTQEPGVPCLGYLANTLWLLGYPDQARQRSQEALTLAHELARPFSEAFALWFVARLSASHRAAASARERAETLIALSTEQGFAQWVGAGMQLRGQALVEQGEVVEGLAQLRQGWAVIAQTGQILGLTWSCVALAEGYVKAGQVREGEQVLAEALEFIEKRGERIYEAEVYRLKGELTLQSQVQGLKSKVEGEAQECLWKAIEIARKQSAKSLELRAVMSLSRLWQQQGQKAEARRLLAEIYGWFTEGFDTKDLQEAKALLAELS